MGRLLGLITKPRAITITRNGMDSTSTRGTKTSSPVKMAKQKP